MRQHVTTRALLSTLLLLPATVSGVLIHCEDLVEDKTHFNFKELGGEHTVLDVRPSNVGILNTTYTIDICNGLTRPKGVDKKHYCGQGTQICAVTKLIDGDNDGIDDVLPIAQGNILGSGADLAPKLTRLKGSTSNEDSKKEGLRIELHGGKSIRDGKKQRAIIEFLCLRSEDDEDSEKTRARRDDDEKKDDGEKDDGDKKDDGDDKDKDGDDEGDDGDDDKKKEEWDKLHKVSDGKGGEIEFLSYSARDNPSTLRMNWHTKYACENYNEDQDSSSPKGGWGFFSWFFFLLFMGVIGYFGFFAWVNYSKYGAHGWDLLPHSDTIRDIPYILGDWGRKVVGTFTGGPGRGGYSAV